MTFPTAALTGGNLTSIHSAKWYGAGYASLCPNTVVWSTTLSATATGTTNAQISYGATITGNAANVQIGHRVLIGTVNDIRKATFSGRARGTPGGGLMAINETSAALTNGMYLWVVDDYPLLDKLARPVGNPPVQYKDFDTAYQGLLPVVVGLQKSYPGWINSSNKLRIAFDVSSSYAAELGATISNYLFTFAAGTFTLISGSLSSAIATVDFNEGFQWGKLTVTDSSNRTQTRHFEIHAHGTSSYPPALSFQGASITGNLNDGYTATVTSYADVSTMLDNTPITLWTQEYYNDVEGPITNNVDMVGWIRHEDDPAQTDPNYSLITSSQFEISGIGTKLARLEAQLLALSNTASPTLWDQINNLTPWRGIVHFLQRHTTLLELVDLTFDATDNTFLFPYLTTQGGNVLAAVNGIADQINAKMEFAPDGAVRVVRDARFLSSSARNALITYANWTAQDYSDPNGVTLAYTHDQDIGRVDADGAFYNSTSGNVTAFRSRAPGLAQDTGQNLVNLNNQILAAGTDGTVAQAELNQRAGNFYEISKTPSYTLPASHPAGYHFLIPSKAIWYTWTLTAGTDNIRGISYDTTTRWLIIDVNITIDNDKGTRTVHVTYLQESAIGNAGTTITIPDPGSIDNALPAFPPFDPFPNFPDDPLIVGVTDGQMPPFVGTGMTGIPGHHIIAPRDGNTVLLWTASQVWTSRSYAARAIPVWTEITPSSLGSYQIKDAKFTPTGQGAYLLVSDGTNSTVLYTADAFNRPVAWSQGSIVTGVYTALRTTSTSGGIMIYAAALSGGSSLQIFDFTLSNGGWICNPAADVCPTWTAGVGWVGGNLSTPPKFSECEIRLALASATITAVRVVYSASEAANGGERGVRYNSHTLYGSLNTGAGSFDTTITSTVAGVTILDVGVDTAVSDTSHNIVSRVEITEAGLTGAAVRYSSSNGTAWSDEIAVGTTPGSVGGFDVNKIGATSIAAMDQKTRSATTLGGAYSDTTGGGTTGAEPLTVLIPRYKFGGTTTNANLSAPDFLLGASALVSSEALWKVSGGTQTAITPSSSGTKALAFSADGAAMTYKNGSIIAYLGKVTGTAHAYTSSNTGGAWTDLGAMAGALSIRIRKSDLRTSPAIFLAGGTVLKYGATLTATPVNRTPPISSGILGLEVLG